MVLVIIIDGCNEYYIDGQYTPFLYDFRKKAKYVSMKPTPSFANRIELFTGNFPGTTGTFVDFCIGSPVLPLRFFSIFNPKATLPKGKRTEHGLPSFPTLLHYLCTGIYVDYANIPTALIPYFSVNKRLLTHKRAEKKRLPDNLLGILEKNGYKTRFIYGTSRYINNKVCRERAEERKVLFLHYSETDYMGHETGPRSQELISTMKLIDTSVEEIFKRFEPALELMLVLSDHGMSEVTTSIDLWKELQKLDIRLKKDYLVFLNSPMARFWFKNKAAKEKIMGLLESLQPYGVVVTKEELRKKNLPTDDKFGEVIFWARQDVCICPDFYHSSEIKGMHGYFDSEERIPFIIGGKDIAEPKRRECSLQDVAPTLLRLLHIPGPQMDGKSLF